MDHRKRISHLLEKINHGQCSSEELKELRSLLGKNNGKIIQDHLDQDIEQLTENKSDFRSKTVWRKIEAQISPSKKSASTYPKIKVLSKYIAAASVIGLLVFFAVNRYVKTPLLKQELVFIENSTSSPTKFILLPDESKVWLGKNSQLKYPTSFVGTNRTVYLEGQAHFDISHDHNRPFLVQSQNLKTQVLGTSFDIKDFTKDSVAQVSLYEGMVNIKTNTGSKNWVLNPEEQLTIKGNHTAIHTFDPLLESAWRTDEFEFRSKKMDEVISFLEKTYKKDISISEESLLEEKISGKFKLTDDLGTILNHICFSKNWKLNAIDNKNYRISQ